MNIKKHIVKYVSIKTIVYGEIRPLLVKIKETEDYVKCTEYEELNMHDKYIEEDM